MTDLAPLGLRALYTRLQTNAHFVDKRHPGDAIVATFQALLEADNLKAADKRDLFECCLYLSLADTLGTGDEARAQLVVLVQANPKFKFRPGSAEDAS